MPLHSSLPAPTKAQRWIHASIRELGCLLCGRPTEIHHLIDGSRRISHAHVIGLCSWHHRGVLDPGLSTSQMLLAYGPSYAIDRKHFRAMYGEDRPLLAKQYERLGLPTPEKPFKRRRGRTNRPSKIIPRAA